MVSEIINDIMCSIFKFTSAPTGVVHRMIANTPPHLHHLPERANIGDMELQCLHALRKALKKEDAAWASEQQKEAVLAVMNHNTDVIAMLKTGGGKSMLAIVPAIISTNFGIVIVLPLKSLMTDWKRKLDAMDILHQEYNPSVNGGFLNPSINLVLVSADQASFPGWRTKIAEFNESLPITRMVFDEAHLPLLSDDFRSALAHVKELRQHSMQLILLSATIPPASINALKTSFGILDNAIEIRQCSNRPELEYILEKPLPNHQLPGKLMDIITREQNRWDSLDRGLVFVAYITDGEELAEKVSVHMYSGNIVH